MILAILGGGGFRVPLVYGALLTDTAQTRIDEIVLHDIDATRLGAISSVLEQMSQGHEDPPKIRTTTDLDEALRGADFVFSAVRVGGTEGRTSDERVALDLGLLGQETTGPGGIAYGLRTVPVAVHIAERIAAICPQAWVINFTNPAGMITEAMQTVLGARVIGICDSPIGLARRATRALGLEAERSSPDYVGLNHLGWLRGLSYEGKDRLPELLAAPEALLRMEEGRLFGPDWIRDLGAIPNEYLYYYYYTRDAIASIRGSADTRGEFLLRQQADFYAETARQPARAYNLWQSVRQERDATYMAESRQHRDAVGRDASDIDGGGYEGVALALMSGIARGEPSTMILNVRNGNAVNGLPPHAVIEVPCAVGADGPHPLATKSIGGDQLGLIQQVKYVEQLTIQAGTTGSQRTALKAFALHPLVDSVATARVLLERYRTAIPSLDAVFNARDRLRLN